ncbi:uncharacterized protein [Pseudorasbora parva]|uniref:uncharacterized protein n=1 Tax=Pseudorasbora parva TaxID=51549 RepID=UPI00351F5A3D
MQTPSATPFADIINSLVALHQDQHQAMLDLRADQERRVQGQQEDRERFRSWMNREVRAEAAGLASAPVHVPLHKMGPEDDPEAFIDLFQKAAEACGLPRAQWPVRLIPLLSGEAQAAAQQLPVANLLKYDDLKRAILQRVGRTPEQHRQRFRSMEWGEAGRPFAMAKQLRDACRRWLLAGGSDVVLEQFIARLPRKTAEWVQCHWPTSLETAINLAEDHLVVCPGVGEPPLTSHSLSPPSVSPSRPVPLPRSHPPGPPRVPPRGRGGMGLGPSGSSRAPPRGAGPLGAGGDNGSGSTPSMRSFSNPLPAAGAAGRPGLACWRARVPLLPRRVEGSWLCGDAAGGRDVSELSLPRVSIVAASPAAAHQTTSVLVGRAYSAAGQTAACLHTVAVLQAYQADLLGDINEETEEVGRETIAEIRQAADLSLRATRETARSIGRSMAALVATERHLWLNLSDIKERDKKFLMDSPVSPTGLFGDAVTMVVNRYQEARKQAAAFSKFLPRKSYPPGAAGRRQPQPSTSSSAAHRAQQKQSVAAWAPPGRENGGPGDALSRDLPAVGRI